MITTYGVVNKYGLVLTSFTTPTEAQCFIDTFVGDGTLDNEWSVKTESHFDTVEDWREFTGKTGENR
jgi:hypothetical protein